MKSFLNNYTTQPLKNWRSAPKKQEFFWRNKRNTGLWIVWLWSWTYKDSEEDDQKLLQVFNHLLYKNYEISSLFSVKAKLRQQIVDSGAFLPLTVSSKCNRTKKFVCLEFGWFENLQIAHYGNFRIFLPLRFYVKSNFRNFTNGQKVWQFSFSPASYSQM